MFRKVRDAVLASTGGRQEPFVYGSLSSEGAYLAARPEPKEPKQVVTDGPEVPKPQPVAPGNDRRLTAEELAAERVFWETVKDSQHAADFEAYLEQFPGGTFEALARNRLARLTGKQDEKPDVQVVVVTPDEPERVLSPEPSAPTPEAVEASLGLDRDERRRIQQGLASLGFDPGPADGLFGQRTRDAIGKWQASQGMSASRHLGADAARLLMAAGEAALEPFGPDWIIAENQPCQLWDSSGVSGDEVVTWSGACVDGKASGQGRAVWRTPRGVYVSEGSFLEGKEHGYVEYSFPSGSLYEGAWREGRPHGHGAYTTADGNVYRGDWRDGCFAEHSGRWAIISSTKEACGFE